MKKLLLLALVFGSGFVELQAVTGREQQRSTMKPRVYRVAKRVIDINNVDEDGNSALHKAAEKNNSEKVKKLLKIPGIKIDLCNNDGETACHLAAVHGLIENVKLLVSKGCRLDIRADDGSLAIDMAGTTEVYTYLRNKMSALDVISADLE